MNYAIVEDGIPAGIGDTWDGTDFYRGGEKLLTLAQQAEKNAQDMRAALALLGVTEESEVQP